MTTIPWLSPTNWAPGVFYTAQIPSSTVFHEDKVYVCTYTHYSGPVFLPDYWQVILTSGYADTATAAASDAQEYMAQAGDHALDAEGSAISAAASAAVANFAMSQYSVTARVFSSTANGLAGTSLGQYFTVVSADPDIFVDLYLHSAGPVATFVKSYPSASGIAQIQSDIDDLQAAGNVGTVDLADNAVTFAKLADLAQGTFIGRADGAGTGDPVALTPEQARVILNVAERLLALPSCATNGGTANAQTVSAPPTGMDAQIVGQVFLWTPSATNTTTTPTLTIGAFPSLEVRRADNTLLQPGDLRAGSPHIVRVSGTGATLAILGMVYSDIYSSPALTGTPTAPTAAVGTNTTQIATAAFVQAAVAVLAATLGALATKSVVGNGDIADGAVNGAKIADGAVTNAKLAQMAAATIKGRGAGAAGDPVDLTATEARALLALDQVDNTPDATKPVSAPQQAALDAKAPLASPALTGTPTAPTAAAGTSTGQLATTAFVRAAADALTLLLTSEETRARAAEAMIASRERPGELASAYAPELAGQIGATTPYGYGAVAGDTALGAVLRLTEATHVATRAPRPIEPGRVYQARWVWRRVTDPTDPAGDTVSVGLVWLTETLDQISSGATMIWRSAPLTVAMGVQRQTATMSLDVPGTDLVIPAAARYARSWLRCYGVDHVTHVATVELIDITEAWLAQSAGSAAGAAVTAEAAARVAADAGLAAQIAGKAATVHGHSVGQVEGLAAELDALIAQLLVVTGLASAAVTQAQLSARVGADGAPVDTAGTWFYRGVEVVWGVGDPDGRGGIALGADGYLRGRLPLLAGLNGINFAEGADGLYRLTLGTVEGQLPLAGGQVIDTTEDRWFRGRAVDTAISDSAGLPGLVVCADGAVALGDGDLCEPRAETLYYEGDAVERAEADPDDRPWLLRLADGRVRVPGLDARDVAPFLPAAVLPRIRPFGDSLTEGTGGGGTTMTSVLALLTGLDVDNGGIGGQNSTPIAMRLGGNVARVTVGSNEISAGANTITAIDSVTLAGAGGMAGDTGRIYPFPLSTAAGNSTRTAKVMIQGVTGTLTRTASGGPPSTVESYTFTPDAGSVLPVRCPPQSPMRFVSTIRAGDWVPIWAGRNDNQLVAVILDNIRKCVAYVRAQGAHPVILTTINGNYASEFAGGANYAAFVDLAAALEDEFPVETIDIRRVLISQGLARAGITPVAQDLTDIANDIVPSSLRSDAIHLNAAGYTVVGQVVYEHLLARGLTPAS